MIAHAAEAGEDRGRIVVRLGAMVPSSRAALEAAVHVARAFNSEIEGIYIEDPGLEAAVAHDRVRFLSLAGGPNRLPRPRLASGLAHFATAANREVAQAAAAAGVAFKSQIVRGEVIEALSAACAERGPWNIVAFTEAISTPGRAEVLNAALTRVWGTTAFVASGPSAVWRAGPIVAVIEDIERMTGMVRAAQRLAAVSRDEVLLLPAGEDAIAQDWLDSEIRLTLGLAAGTTLLPRPVHGGAAGIRSEIERLSPRMVLARYGGQAIAADGTASALAELSAPVFILH